MINLYELLNLPTDASDVAITRSIRLARERQDIEERYLKLAENYLLHPKRRAQYHKQIGIKNRPRRSSLAVAGDWRYVGSLLLMVAVLVVPLIIVMVGQQQAVDGLTQQKNQDYQGAQNAMVQAWGASAASDTSMPQAIERGLNNVQQRQQRLLDDIQ